MDKVVSFGEEDQQAELKVTAQPVYSAWNLICMHSPGI